MKITAVVGSYRRGGTTESAVDELLDAAREAGAEVQKLNLLDKHVEFCTNCRACTQEEGDQRGECPLDDEMGAMLDELEQSDGIVLASPMNFGTVTALMKRFIERFICYGYWPWGGMGPKNRTTERNKRAVVVAVCAAPSWLVRWTTDMVKVMKRRAKLVGAGKIKKLWVGMAAQQPEAHLGDRSRKKARKLGRWLAS